jgi:hypothetical protein
MLISIAKFTFFEVPLLTVTRETLYGCEVDFGCVHPDFYRGVPVFWNSERVL